MAPPRTNQRPARERGDGRVAYVGPLQGGKWTVGSRCAVVRTCSWPSSGRIAEELTGCGGRYGRHYGSRQEAPGQTFRLGGGRVRRSINEEAAPSRPPFHPRVRSYTLFPSSARTPLMPPISFTVNGKRETVNVTPDTPLLWVLRDTLGLTGTKFGCGIAQCGACTVHLDGVATRTCVLPVAAVAGKRVTTIEDLSKNRSHAVQRAWIEEDVPQCGYCQPGQIMAAAALLARTPHPTDADIDTAMTNICRCGTYQRIRAAIHRAAQGA